VRKFVGSGSIKKTSCEETSMNTQKSIAPGYWFSLSVLLFFIIWAEVDPKSLRHYGNEDYVIENLSAFFFLVASFAFFIVAKSSSYLRARSTPWAYFMIISWALLMFIFFGEEISWGQRILGFSTPETLSEINKQDEFNIHNIDVVDIAFGGKYRYLSVMMLLTGIAFPLAAQTSSGKWLFQKICFPVCPLQFGLLFLGSYLFGKYYAVWNPLSQLGGLIFIAEEVREFLFSLGMLCFAVYGAYRPDTLFLAEGKNIE